MNVLGDTKQKYIAVIFALTPLFGMEAAIVVDLCEAITLPDTIGNGHI